MKGYTFYAEMPEERKSKSASKAYPFQPWTRQTLRHYITHGKQVNCIAVLKGSQRLDRNAPVEPGKARPVIYDAVAAVYGWLNSAVSSASTSSDYLRKRAVRVDEHVARRLHPALFAFLDQGQD